MGGVGVTTRSKIQDSLATGPRERPTGRSTGPLSKRKRRLPSCPMTRRQVAQGSFATRNLPQRCWQWLHPARARASRPGSRDPRSHVARPLRRSLDGSRWWCWQSSQFSCLRCHFGCSPGLFRRRTNCAAANGTRLSANRPAHGMNSMSSNWGTSRVRSRGNVFRRRLSVGKRWGLTGFGAIRGGARGGRVRRCPPGQLRTKRKLVAAHPTPGGPGCVF